MMNHYNFARNLVKGKIAETIFAQMLRETGEFTVLEFGYEKVIPELLSRDKKLDEDSGIIKTLRSAPDFAVINQKTKKVHLIEVKYQRKLNKDYVLEVAQRMHESWNPSYLFIATLDGFFFDEIVDVIKDGGKIKPMVHQQIPAKTQEKYLQILIDFEGQN